MKTREKIDQYDLVEIIQVPEQYEGVIDIGDVGTVVEKYGDENFEVECLQPGGFTKWLATLHVRYVRLRSKDPYNPWIEKSLPEQSMMQKSIHLGFLLGAAFGGLIGAGLGAITMTLSGLFVGLAVGLVGGMITGALTAALTVKMAGTTGGIGVGYFVGMVFGGILGTILGALIPTSLRTSANTQDVPVLDALSMGRFETAMLAGFLLSILGTMVGTCIGGKNLAPRALKVNKHDRIDQYDLVEVIHVPEKYTGVIGIGDVGVVVEILDPEDYMVECVNPDGSYKWLEALNSKYVRLKSKIPDNM
jgi:hypothetical protein